MAAKIAEIIGLTRRAVPQNPSKEGILGKVRTRIDSLASYLDGLGVYGVDPVKASRPNLDGRLTDWELECLVLQNDLAWKIVSKLPEHALYRTPVQLQNTETQEKRPLKALAADPDALDVVGRIFVAAAAARQHGSAAILVIPADVDGYDLASERPEGPIEVANLLVLNKTEMEPLSYSEELDDPDYGEAVLYKIQPQLANIPVSDPILERVHRSWFVFFDGKPILSKSMQWAFNRSHDSVLQAVYEELQNFWTTERSIVNMIRRAEITEIGISGLHAVLEDEDHKSLIQERMDLMHRSLALLRAAIIDPDAGEFYRRSFANFAGLDSLWDRMAHSVARAADTPFTMLFGASPAGLSNDDKSGRATWAANVSTYQTMYLSGPLRKLARMVFGENWEPYYAPIQETTPMEDSEIEQKSAAAWSMAVSAKAASPADWRRDLHRKGLIQRLDGRNPDEMTDEELGEEVVEAFEAFQGEVPEALAPGGTPPEFQQGGIDPEDDAMTPEDRATAPDPEEEPNDPNR